MVQGTAGTPTASLTDFVGVDLLGQTRTEKITSGEAPTLTVGSLGQTVSVSASTGNEGKESGLYSGYISVPMTPSLPGGSPRTEEVPVIATDGFKPVFRSLAIHDISANDFTLSLIPALPPAAKMLDHPLHMLPVDPLNQTLAFKVTGARSCVKYGKGDPNNPDPGTCYGHGVFGVVPPGYYLVRQFSDYGVPVEWTVNAKDASGLPITLPKSAEIGNPLGYTSFETLLLPRAFDGPPTDRRLCQENYGPWDDWAGHSGSEQEVQSWKDAGIKMWKPCTQNFLENRFEPLGQTPKYDRFIGGFVVKQTAPLPDLRLNLGFVRKRSEAAVSSRYIDILHPCQELRFLSFRTPPITSLESLSTLATEPTTDWSTGCDGLETFLATFNNPGSDSTVEIGVGLAEYPFNLTTPNYTTHLSLNFPYEVNNAFILVAVSIGAEVGWGVVAPPGVIRLPPSGLGTEINLGGVEAAGFGSGTANFEFRFLSRGASSGVIQFLFVPAQYRSSGGTSSPVPSWAVLKDNALANETVSLEVDTWALVPWPAMNFRHRLDDPITQEVEPLEPCSKFGLLANECGPTFRLSSNFSPWRGDSEGDYLGGQIRGESRAIDNGSENAEVKEDWVVLVHSPELPAQNAALIGSSLMDVVDASNPDHLTSILGALKAAGAALYTPDAATHSAEFLIAFNGGIEAGEILSTKLGGKLLTTRDFFELLAMPMSFLSQFPGSIEVCINDGLPRTTSLCPGTKDAATGAWTVQEVPVDLSLPKTEGPAEVSPYVPYRTQSTFIE